MADDYTLPTEPGFYVGQRDSFWQLDSEGKWWFHGYPDRNPTPDQRDRTSTDALTYGVPMRRMIPETDPVPPFCDQCSGPYGPPYYAWLAEPQYGGHWDTCPNRPEAKR